MTRLNMSPPDKRRGPVPSPGSPSRHARPGGGGGGSAGGGGGGGGGSSSSNAASSSATATRTFGIIAPPPRAALSGTSSPAPDGTGGPSQPPTSASKEGGGGGGGGGGVGHYGGGSSSSSAAYSSGSGSNNNNNNASGGGGSTAADAREKDSRISYLERELEIMEDEFRRELDRLSANESETASFWQARHSALNQQFLRTDTELRLLRSEAEALRSGAETAGRVLRTRDAEVRDLRAQVRGLKEWVSTSTRSDGETRTSDEVFGDGMARLGNGLQNWVIVNFRKARLDLSKADDSTLAELGRLVPAYEDLVQASKVHLLQSIVSRILVELVFDTYFVGLSAGQALQFAEMEEFLSSFTSSTEPISQWRSLTLTILKKDAANKMKTETSNVTETVVSRVNSMLDSITETKTTETRDQALTALVASAIELSRLLVIQKAAFKVWMPEILPHQRTMFDPATMEDIGGEDEESLAEREICCITFPGIIKTGDENGGGHSQQYRNVISKARVLCRPE